MDIEIYVDSIDEPVESDLQAAADLSMPDTTASPEGEDVVDGPVADLFTDALSQLRDTFHRISSRFPKLINSVKLRNRSVESSQTTQSSVLSTSDQSFRRFPVMIFSSYSYVANRTYVDQGVRPRVRHKFLYVHSYICVLSLVHSCQPKSEIKHCN